MSIEDAFEGLRQRFRESTATRLEEMSRGVDALEADLGDRAAFDVLARHFHGLAGLGSTYGFPRITELAEVGEGETIALRDGGRPDSLRLKHWRELVVQMGVALQGEEASPVRPFRAALRATVPGEFTVLLVEDDPELAGWLAQLIEAEGMSVRIQSTRAAAIEDLREALPDALVCDISLPDGSGSEVIESLRALPDGDGTTAIAISISEGFDAKVEAIRAGADAYFAKPIDENTFLRRLSAARDRKAQPPERILVVEDDPLYAELVHAVLTPAGYEVHLCPSPDGLDEAVASATPDLVLMDVNFPGGINGYDLVRYLRQSDRFATLPVIFVTTEREASAVAKTRRAGGDDHLVKPIEPAHLLTAVAARLERARVLRALIDHDGLTGALTHAAFRSRIDLAATRSRAGTMPVLAMLDLDHFKRINDTYGHRAGDRVLSSFGTFLRQHVRYTDSVGRYGGEEFALLLEGTTTVYAVQLIERLLAEFREIEHVIDGKRFKVAFSSGVAALDPNTRSVEAWIEASDQALYEAKRLGRGRVVSAPA